MSHFGSYPVVRVRLDPGEGYMAPTENLIHDATTSSPDALDVQFRVCGRFWPMRDASATAAAVGVRQSSLKTARV